MFNFHFYFILNLLYKVTKKIRKTNTKKIPQYGVDPPQRGDNPPQYGVNTPQYGDNNNIYNNKYNNIDN